MAESHPKKKRRKKSGGKKEPTHRTAHTIEDDIRVAVDQIPSLLFEDVKETPPTSHHTKKTIPYYQEPEYATFLTWVGVTAVTLFLLVLWGWNMKTAISDVLTKQKESPGILSNAKNELGTIVSTLDQSNTKKVTLGTTTSGASTTTIAAAIEQLIKTAATGGTSSSTLTTTQRTR